LVFDKNANFFAENWQKSPKIDHNIDPRLGEFSLFGQFLFWEILFEKWYKEFLSYFLTEKLRSKSDKVQVGLHFGRFFTPPAYWRCKMQKLEKKWLFCLKAQSFKQK
jgi:hypothetical protein